MSSVGGKCGGESQPTHVTTCPQSFATPRRDSTNHKGVQLLCQQPAIRMRTSPTPQTPQHRASRPRRMFRTPTGSVSLNKSRENRLSTSICSASLAQAVLRTWGTRASRKNKPCHYKLGLRHTLPLKSKIVDKVGCGCTSHKSSSAKQRHAGCGDTQQVTLSDHHKSNKPPSNTPLAASYSLPS